MEVVAANPDDHAEIVWHKLDASETLIAVQIRGWRWGSPAKSTARQSRLNTGSSMEVGVKAAVGGNLDRPDRRERKRTLGW